MSHGNNPVAFNHPVRSHIAATERLNEPTRCQSMSAMRIQPILDSRSHAPRGNGLYSRSHAPRGNGLFDALRRLIILVPTLRVGTGSSTLCVVLLPRRRASK